MKCNECVYCWKEDDEDFACCHFAPRAPGEEAPCEYDDYEECSDDPDLWCDPEWMEPAPAEEVIGA